MATLTDQDLIYKQIVDFSQDGILFADRDGIIRLWNLPYFLYGTIEMKFSALSLSWGMSQNVGNKKKSRTNA